MKNQASINAGNIVKLRDAKELLWQKTEQTDKTKELRLIDVSVIYCRLSVLTLIFLYKLWKIKMLMKNALKQCMV